MQQSLLALLAVCIVAHNCVLGQLPSSQPGGLIGGKFWLGVNLGAQAVIPFASSQYNMSAADIKQLHAVSIADIAASGANLIRFWLHVDGSLTPTWSPPSNSSGPGIAAGFAPDALADLKWLLQVCDGYGLKMLISLWSHDILAVRRFNPDQNRMRAIHTITTWNGTKAYIENVVVPLVRHLRNTALPTSDKSYADVVLGYEVFNEAEGTCWDTRLYHNYMYTTKFGMYKYENPDVFDQAGARSQDRRSVAFIEQAGGFSHVDPYDSTKAAYLGFAFLGGHVQGVSQPPVCYSEDEYMALRAQSLRATNASRQLARWQDGTGVNYMSIPTGYWFNDYMYWDVFAYFNSEYEYLIPKVATCALVTRDIPMAAMQRFINAVAGAMHRADPSVKVGAGMHSTPYMSDAQFLKGSIPSFERNPHDSYKCAALQAAWQGVQEGAFDPQGCLDCYAPHAYPDWANDANTKVFSPFFRAKADYAVAGNVPLLLGEFWDLRTKHEPLTAQDWAGLYSRGYAGGLGWAWLAPYEYQVAVADANSTAPVRVLDKHELQDTWRRLLKEASTLLRSQGVPL